MNEMNVKESAVVKQNLRNKILEIYKDPVLETEIIDEIDYINVIYSSKSMESRVSCRESLLRLLKKDERLIGVIEKIAEEKGLNGI
jgi:hypothetical protein